MLIPRLTPGRRGLPPSPSQSTCEVHSRGLWLESEPFLFVFTFRAQLSHVKHTLTSQRLGWTRVNTGVTTIQVKTEDTSICHMLPPVSNQSHHHPGFDQHS